MQDDPFVPNSALVIEATADFDAGRYPRSAALWEGLALRAESLSDRRSAASAWGAAAEAWRRAKQPYLAALDDIRSREHNEPEAAR